MARSRPSSSTEIWAGLHAGAKVLVDSAPLIYFLQDHPEFAPRFAGLFEAEAAGQLGIVLSTITVAEILAGPFKQGQTALAKRYEKALSGYELVPVNVEIAVSAARLRARYALKLPDALQLATALEVGAQALVTHDRDFAKVEGLLILDGAALQR